MGTPAEHSEQIEIVIEGERHMVDLDVFNVGSLVTKPALLGKNLVISPDALENHKGAVDKACVVGRVLFLRCLANGDDGQKPPPPPQVVITDEMIRNSQAYKRLDAERAALAAENALVKKFSFFQFLVAKGWMERPVREDGAVITELPVDGKFYIISAPIGGALLFYGNLPSKIGDRLNLARTERGTSIAYVFEVVAETGRKPRLDIKVYVDQSDLPLVKSFVIDEFMTLVNGDGLIHRPSTPSRDGKQVAVVEEAVLQIQAVHIAANDIPGPVIMQAIHNARQSFKASVAKAVTTTRGPQLGEGASKQANGSTA